MIVQSDVTRAKLLAAFKDLQLAALRSKRDGTKVRIPIAKVARAVGCSNALIHNKYPEVAEKIRTANGESTEDRKKNQTEKNEKYKIRNKELNSEVTELKALLKATVSKNSTLILENKRLQAEIERLHQGIRTIPRQTGRKPKK